MDNEINAIHLALDTIREKVENIYYDSLTNLDKEIKSGNNML